MQRPTIYIDATEAPEIGNYVSQSAVCKQFTTTYSSADCHWTDELAERDDLDLALIYLSDVNPEAFANFLASDTLDHMDIIFFSDGEPNTSIDQLIAKGGCFHFREPFNLEVIDDTIGDFYEEYASKDSATASAVSSELDQFGLLLGSSRIMHKLYRVLRKVAWSESNVLVIGESGVGKELVANTLHLSSQRSEKPFVAINCGALSHELVESELFGHIKGSFTGATKDKQGFFKQAEGGTLFLDEITEMPLEHQVKLLRVLETGEYRPVGSVTTHIANVRVIGATNRDPASAIEENLLREDLYYRLAQFPINIPALRERGDDVTGLALHFLAHRNAEEDTNKEIQQAALEKIRSHNWPGNVRELRHVMERSFILSEDVIQADHIVLDNLNDATVAPTQIAPGIPLADIERAAIETTLEANEGNRGETADQLGISVKTLYNKLEKYQQVKD